MSSKRFKGDIIFTIMFFSAYKESMMTRVVKIQRKEYSDISFT
jgi:hypothetical protein